MFNDFFYYIPFRFIRVNSSQQLRYKISIFFFLYYTEFCELNDAIDTELSRDYIRQELIKNFFKIVLLFCLATNIYIDNQTRDKIKKRNQGTSISSSVNLFLYIIASRVTKTIKSLTKCINGTATRTPIAYSIDVEPPKTL